MDIRRWEVGAKRRLNGTSNRRTNRQTDISTYRKHRPRGPMLWKSVNLFKITLVPKSPNWLQAPVCLLKKPSLWLKSILKLELWNLKSQFSFKPLVFLEQDMTRSVLSLDNQLISNLWASLHAKFIPVPKWFFLLCQFF